jgi:hypothetical protein
MSHDRAGWDGGRGLRWQQQQQHTHEQAEIVRGNCHGADQQGLDGVLQQQDVRIDEDCAAPKRHTGPSTASVTYTILLAGKPVVPHATGTAVKSGGTWLVSDASFCQLLRLEGAAPPGCPKS